MKSQNELFLWMTVAFIATSSKPWAQTKPDTSRQYLGKTQVLMDTPIPSSETSGFALDKVELKDSRDLDLSVQDVLARSSGIVVRQEGGLGSNSNLSMTGMSGNHIRIFMDGIPLDLLGTGISLGDIPPNTVEEIEIFKGVVPVYLGADALGGAINVVTHSVPQNFTDASVSYGSYNTYKANVNTLYRLDEAPFAVRAMGYYNYSDNNYPITVQLVDPNTGKYSPPQDVERFHDAYQSWRTAFEIGFLPSDQHQLWVGGAIGSTDNEVQHAISLDRVFGEVERATFSNQTSIRYQNPKFFLNNLSMRFFASYNWDQTDITDTSSLKYDWLGNSKPRNNPEIGEALWYKTLYRIWEEQGSANLNLNYTFLNQRLEWNTLFYRYANEGEDRLDIIPVPISPPSTVYKTVTGLSHSIYWWQDFLTTTTFAKLYQQHAELGAELTWSQDAELKKAESLNWGAGVAIASEINKHLDLRASYEEAIRLAEPEELLGDALLLRANPDLEPERSSNINLGLRSNYKLGSTKLYFNGNWFWRNVRNMVRLESEGVTSRYVNQAKVRISGVEADFGASINKWLDLNSNITYQDLRNNTPIVDGRENIVYWDRIPNIPWLFGNAGAALHWHEPFSWLGKITLSSHARYIKEYFLLWPSLGDPNTKHTIPSQLTYNTGLTITGPKNHLTLSVECQNLSDEKVYDNFRLQKPGRTWSAKLRLTL